MTAISKKMREHITMMISGAYRPKRGDGLNINEWALIELAKMIDIEWTPPKEHPTLAERLDGAEIEVKIKGVGSGKMIIEIPE